MRRVLVVVGLALGLAHPAAGATTTWTLVGRVTLTLWSGGQTSVHPAEEVQNTLILSDDRTYRVPRKGRQCADGPDASFDEVGTWRRGRGGRIVLRPTNLDELRQAAGQCLGFPLEITRHRQWVVIERRAQRLRGRSKWVGRATVNGRVLSFSLVERFEAVPATSPP